MHIAMEPRVPSGSRYAGCARRLSYRYMMTEKAQRPPARHSMCVCWKQATVCRGCASEPVNWAALWRLTLSPKGDFSSPLVYRSSIITLLQGKLCEKPEYSCTY